MPESVKNGPPVTYLTASLLVHPAAKVRLVASTLSARFGPRSRRRNLEARDPWELPGIGLGFDGPEPSREVPR